MWEDNLILDYLMLFNLYLAFNNGETIERQSTGSPSRHCLSHKTITIISDGVISNTIQYGLEGLVYHLRGMIEQEPCYTFYVYLSREQRFMKWTHKDEAFQNRIENNNLILLSPNETLQVIKKYGELITTLRSAKQTLVYFALSDLYKRNQGVFDSLRNLQVDDNVEVVVICVVATCPTQGEEWIPFYRILPYENTQSSQTTMQLYRNLKDLLKNPNFNRYEYMRTVDLLPELVINPECVKDINFIHIAMDKITDPFLPMALKFIEQENIHRQKANLQPLAIVFQCSFVEKESLEFWGYYFHRIREHYTIYPGILVSSLPESPILGTTYVYKAYNQVKNTRFYIS
eukprot:TCONS_00052592-protein